MTNSIATTVVGSDGKLRFNGQHRGICGPAIRAASTNQVRMFRELIRDRQLPVQLIGVGGAAEDALAEDQVPAADLEITLEDTSSALVAGN